MWTSDTGHSVTILNNMYKNKIQNNSRTNRRYNESTDLKINTIVTIYRSVYESLYHSLSNKQLFNFSENRRPEVVFIGVNYVTFVSGYDPSANLSGVLL